MGEKINKSAQEQWQVRGVVMAPVEQVWAVLLASNTTISAVDRAAIAQHTAVEPFITSIDKPQGGRIAIEVDTRQHSIAIQGGWWYRGVQLVEAHPQGSLLVYRVYNIAPGLGWWVAQLVQGRNHARAMRTNQQQSLQAISKQLGCQAYLVN